jgi:hypothetical protein
MFDYMFSLEEVDNLLNNFKYIKKHEYFCEACKVEIKDRGFSALYKRECIENVVICKKCGIKILNSPYFKNDSLNNVINIGHLKPFNLKEIYNNMKELEINPISHWGFKSCEDFNKLEDRNENDDTFIL